MRETDLADELFGQPGKTALPAGVRVATARQGGVTITRVEIAREGLARPRGRYVTLNVWAGNTSAEHFYEKMGMKTKKRQMEYIL